jgi:4-coumarate--CoA ligase
MSSTSIRRSPNSLAWPFTLLGCVAAGLKCTLANSAYTPPELAHQLKDSGAGYVFVHSSLLLTLFKAWELLKIPAKEAQKRVSNCAR